MNAGTCLARCRPIFWRRKPVLLLLLSRDTRPSRLSILQFANGPKRSMGHVLKAKKINFWCRDTDDPTMAAAPAESCRFVALRSPWSRSGSVLVTCNRLRRRRRRFHQGIHISNLHGSARTCSTSPQSFGSRALWRASSVAVCGLGDYPTSDLSRRASKGRSAPKKSK